MRHHRVQQADRRSQNGVLIMVEFKNRLTGTLMAVAPEREAEYLAAGHTRVDAPAAAAPARQPAEEPAEEPAAKQSTFPATKTKAAARK